MGTEGGTWRRLTPLGAGAVTVIALRNARQCWPPWLLRRGGMLRAWPNEGQYCVADLRARGLTLDQVLVSAPSPNEREVHLHGGPGVLAAVSEALAHEGWREEPVVDGAAPGCLRASVAAASALWGWGSLSLRSGRDLLNETAPALLERSLRRHASRLMTPAVVRLIGRPNAGKSTLFNRLLSEERALVSGRAGTTRDTLRAPLSLHGVPIWIEDTPGSLSLPSAEAPGREVDLSVHVLSSEGEEVFTGGTCLAVGGRADCRYWRGRLAVSGVTGAGLARLRLAVAAALGISPDPAVDSWAGALVEGAGAAVALGRHD